MPVFPFGISGRHYASQIAHLAWQTYSACQRCTSAAGRVASLPKATSLMHSGATYGLFVRLTIY